MVKTSMWTARSILWGQNVPCQLKNSTLNPRERAHEWRQFGWFCSNSRVYYIRQPYLDTFHFSSHPFPLPPPSSPTRWLLHPGFLHLSSPLPGRNSYTLLPTFPSRLRPALSPMWSSCPYNPYLACPHPLLAEVTGDLSVAKSGRNSHSHPSGNHFFQVSMIPWALKLLWAKGREGWSCGLLSTYTPFCWGTEGLSPEAGSWEVSTTCLKHSRPKAKLLGSQSFYFENVSWLPLPFLEFSSPPDKIKVPSSFLVSLVYATSSSQSHQLARFLNRADYVIPGWK